jgi:phosphatidylserine decarboxylase
MIAKEGYKIIIYTFILAVCLFVCAHFFELQTLNIFGLIVSFIFVFHFFFFRNPERKIPRNDNVILSPADGTILKVTEVEEPIYHKEKVWQVCIFMSVFNAHINRMPVSGVVDWVEYQKGKFRVASLDAAMEQNEHTQIGIKHKKGKVFFKQIAGLIARRIVNRAKQGEEVKQGDRFGLIKYSSRVDLYLPLSVNIAVKAKDKVKAGLSVIGEYQ